MSGRILVATLMAALAGVVALPAVADAAPVYRIVDLGVGDNSEATAINIWGHVVGQRDGHPFLWRNGQATDLLPTGEFGRAADINNRDEIVGTHSVNGFTHGFLWRAGVVADLGVLPGGDSSFASGINDNGDIAGWSATATGSLHAVHWHDGVMTDLGVLPGGFLSVARDINRAGVLVGDADVDGFNRVAVRWTPNGEIQPLTPMPSTALAVNDFGDVTGVISGSTTHGFLWHRGQLTEIPAPPAPFIPTLQPHGINNRSQIVGSANADAFLWHRGQLTLLPSLVNSAVAQGINDRGQIVGSSASRPGMDARFHAVLWTR